MINFALLVLRLTFGSLLMGHGAQKLFGAFEGPGIEGTSGFMESLNLRPSKPWAYLAGISEFGGGLLTALGFLGSAGPLASVGSMLMGTFTVHRGKPIWVTSGGAELPVTNMAIASALMLSGPGAYSVDEALGTHLPRWIALPGLALVGAGVALGLRDEVAALAMQARKRVQNAQGAQPDTAITSGVEAAAPEFAPEI